jgi:ATP-dependent Clp protease adapter protein ClpS
MGDVVAAAGTARLIIHNDDNTPVDFVRDLLREVFGKSNREAIAHTTHIEEHDCFRCGPYPAPVAQALLESAHQFIRTAGHLLRVTSEAVRTHDSCDLCSAIQSTTEFTVNGKTVCLCSDCLLMAREASETMPAEDFRLACVALDWHFAGIARHELVTRTREFPGHVRADIQTAIDRLFIAPLHFFGVHEDSRYETLSFTRLMRQHNPPAIAPPLYRDIDIGEDQPMKCLDNGLWLCRDGELRYAVLLCSHREYDTPTSIRIAIAVPREMVSCSASLLSWRPPSARRAPIAARCCR